MSLVRAESEQSIIVMTGLRMMDFWNSTYDKLMVKSQFYQ